MERSAAVLEQRAPSELEAAMAHVRPDDPDVIASTDDNEFVDTRGASRMTNGLVSEASFARMRQDGTGPVFCKLGHRTVAYRRGAIRDWLLQRERTSTLKP